jgi:asparagine synthase (glutamine-hydrolysing)
MCGIAGLFTPGRRVEPEALERMAATLAHRGPDARAVWAEADVGLAHTRLAVVDLSPRAAQPMHGGPPGRRAVLSFNGEIYNHRRLRALLEDRGVRLRSMSDTEVLLEGFVLYGPSFLARVEGMFAFALWEQDTRTLHLVRDRAGEKPLYYAPLPSGGVAFGSEPKAVRAVVPLEADFTRLPSYLLNGYVAPPQTFYRGLRALKPGHHLTVRADEAHRLQRYWAPTFSGTSDAPSYGDATRALRARFGEVVRERLEADVPVGAFLSGGLDSAAVVGVATRDLGRTVHTYSIGFDEPGFDEAPDARLSAEHLGSIHTEFRVGVADVPPIELLVHHHDGPFADSSAIPTYLVSKLARAHVTVALTGDGGDELFAGYPRFLGAALGQHMPQRAAQALARLSAKLADVTLSPMRHRFAQVMRFAEAAERPLPQRIAHWNAIIPTERLPALVKKEFATDLRRAVRFSDETFFDSRGQTPLDRMLDHNFRTYLAEDLLPKVDRMSMAVSLETRAPFLDSGLIDFAGTLPDSYKLRGTTLKRIVRDAFADLFAPALLTRPKRGFGVPLELWLRGPLRDAWESVLLPSDARIHRYLDRATTRAMLAEAPAASRGWMHQVFALWTLETWLRRERA